MNIKILITIAILSMFAYACNQKDRVEKLKTEVMAVHDEVMPEMDNLMNLKKQLENRILTLDSAGANTDEIKRFVQNLVEADEAMMDWMRNYKDPSPEMSEGQALEYLQDKMESIKEVKRKINSSKAAAETALNQ